METELCPVCGGTGGEFEYIDVMNSDEKKLVLCSKCYGTGEVESAYKPELTNATLSALLFSPCHFQTEIAGVFGSVVSIERDDGSGKRFNVTMLKEDGSEVIVYVRTVDE